MEDKIKQVTQLLIRDTITKDAADKILLDLFSVSGGCYKLISDIEKLSRYNMYGTESEGSVEFEYCNDGENVDADELYKILDNYR